MRIKASLLILSILVVLGLILIEGNLILSLKINSQFQEIKTQAASLNDEFRRFWLLTERLVTNPDYSRALKDWKEQKEVFFNQIHVFTDEDKMGGRARTDQDRESAEKIQKLLDLLLAATNEAEAVFDEFLEENPSIYQGLIFEQLVKHDYKAGLARRQVTNLSVYFDGTVDKALNELNERLDERGSQIQTMLLVISLLFTVIILAVISIMVASFRKILTRNVTLIQESITRLSQGNFSALTPVKGKSEFADISSGINKVIEDISDILHGLKQMAGEASELKNDVSAATEESTAAMTEMSANITSITVQVDRLLDNLSSAKSAIGGIAGNISSFSEVLDSQAVSVNQSTSAIEEIKASIQNVSKLASSRQEAFENLIRLTQESGDKLNETNILVKANAEDVENIVEIIGLINNVAEQTDILSMNAAIEAAHAGEYGRGFAVVAEEIRKLAEDTNENSKVIKTAIETIADRISKVHEASELSRRAFEAIEKETTDTGKIMTEISTTMQELSSGSTEVMNAMIQINENSSRIKDDSDSINSGIQQINTNFDEISKAGDMARTGVGEVEVGIREINKAMIEVNDLNKRSSEAIEMITDGIKRFKVLGEDHGDTETLDQLQPEDDVSETETQLHQKEPEIKKSPAAELDETGVTSYTGEPTEFGSPEEADSE